MLDRFRDKDLVQGALAEIRKITTRPWAIMEICGGQTHAIMQYGLNDLLPKQIELIHGPGCPVCVTSLELVDKAIAIASRENVIFTSYGDMLRVPGSQQDLFSVKAAGGDVRVVYSAIEAVRIAEKNPDKEVVFFGIGFETTAPANAISVVKAKRQGIRNYSMLVSHVCVPPAMHAILGSPNNRVQGFLAAGHVCAVMGYEDYKPIAQQYGVPMAVTGFEPLDLTLGILDTVRMLEKGEVKIVNSYSRAVTREGNRIAQQIIADVFEPCDRQWRGIGLIPMSGWKLKSDYVDYDAELKFQVQDIQTKESEVCISGQILQGLKKPNQCPAFGTLCTPQNPLGATMVSSEGACSAYYRYARD
ncbi:hydrogenase formation protein HypD [Pelolinea submarina]|uniref:Hydrogenase expression/formation protein HypD n=1 Tax=Pelolinea submarina TaxID=913107 RepID=A0A347ZTR6_9CHLR|nr:hydrogenase formation protein HypD [Pelolinea submarina]REG10722.1 hydrogenase expression/formation protein HypD [Pelolinea submarina]BBB48697.1 hydrogenase expression/formation protein HypD [Pelolinea submarina]